MGRSRVICLLGLLILLLCCGAVTSVQAADVTLSMTELREEYVVIQTHWWSCGAAAVATLLTHYYDIPVTEAEVLAFILRGSAGVTVEQTDEHALTLLALKLVLQAKGLEAKAYRLDGDALYDYFARGGLPVILHLAYPRAHFVVGVGVVGEGLAVADPSFGERYITWADLAATFGFTGYVLVPIPSNRQLTTVAARQAAALERITQRYTRLTAVGGDLHHW